MELAVALQGLAQDGFRLFQVTAVRMVVGRRGLASIAPRTRMRERVTIRAMRMTIFGTVGDIMRRMTGRGIRRGRAIVSAVRLNRSIDRLRWTVVVARIRRRADIAVVGMGSLPFVDRRARIVGSGFMGLFVVAIGQLVLFVVQPSRRSRMNWSASST